MTVSADLLFNLPGQFLSDVKDDVSQAVNLGLDQICLYHLVLFRGIAASWARDAFPRCGGDGTEWRCTGQRKKSERLLTNFAGLPLPDGV